MEGLEQIIPEGIPESTETFSWSDVGASMETGGSIGAAIASIIPGIGTVVGTIIGSIIGFFAGLSDELESEMANHFLRNKFWIYQIFEKVYGYNGPANCPRGLYDAMRAHKIHKDEYYYRHLSFAQQLATNLFISTKKSPSQEQIQKFIEDFIPYIVGEKEIPDLYPDWDYEPFKKKLRYANNAIQTTNKLKSFIFGTPAVFFKGTMNKSEWMNTFINRAVDVGDALPFVWSKAAYDIYFLTNEAHNPPRMFASKDILEGKLDLKKAFTEKYNYHLKKLFCKKVNWEYPPCKKVWNTKGLTKEEAEALVKDKTHEYNAKLRNFVEKESRDEYNNLGKPKKNLDNNKSNIIIYLAVGYLALKLLNRGK
ncbi:MAG: hypothetical protein DRH24_15980 [Deltaproteobacteria bacterium]|nr:MAG: hypothetical protein DRH24_15980 [Deltaproteobacteria bacterium]